jgi:formate hydrogenlyase subunit 3/multisubunit Na+/H+ antiporter MnhD subunit
MLYLLLIFFPISMAASCFVLRKQTSLVVVAAVAAVLTQIALVVQIPLDEPARLLGVTLALNELTRLFMLVFLGIGVVAFLASLHLPHGENFVPVTLLILVFVCMTLLLQDPFIVSLLLVWAGIAAVLAIVDLPTGAGTLVSTRVFASALKYLILMVLAGVLMYLSFILADIYKPGEVPGRIPLARFILALLIAGFSLRLALIPFHTWLPDMVEDAAPMVSAVVIALINTTSFIMLVLSFQRFPVLVTENPTGIMLLRVGGIATSILAAIMSLNQPTPRRILAYLLIYNSGIIFYGLTSVSISGLTGALFEALNQVLLVFLLFISLGLLERPDGRPPGVERRDLLRRWPIAGTAFLAGGLALLGLPPLSGFAGKMLIYQAAAQQGWIELFPMLIATALALLGLIRLAAHWLLGPSTEPHTPQKSGMIDDVEMEEVAARRLAGEPRGTALLALLLLTLSLAMGLYPRPFLLLIEQVIQGLTFVSLR